MYFDGAAVAGVIAVDAAESVVAGADVGSNSTSAALRAVFALVIDSIGSSMSSSVV